VAFHHRNFIYNEERGFIFAYVPKVACTNWKALLRLIAGYPDWLDNRLAHDVVNGGLRYLDLEGPDSDLLDDPAIRKYTMVRDPYSRVLSAYLNKFDYLLSVEPTTENELYFHKVLRGMDRFRREELDEETYPEISFPVFLQWVKSKPSPDAEDEHWMPQALMLRQPDVHFDIVGKFENLAEDSARILSAMGCDQAFPSQEDVRFAPTGASDKIAQYYTPAAYALVNELFSEDFAIFDYPMRNRT